MAIVYCENRFLPEEEASIPITDRGFQVGDGAFSVIQVNDGTPLFLATHLERLKYHSATINLTIPSLAPSLIEELIYQNSAEHGIWRLKIVVTGGDSPAIDLPERSGRVVMTLKPFEMPPFKRLKMGIFPIPYTSCHAGFKSLSHLNRFYVMQEAKKLGVDDCVTCTESGNLLEAAYGNLFWVVGKRFFTPDPKLSLSFGVTISNCARLAQEMGYQIEYYRGPIDQIPQEALLFRTNTMQSLRPIAQIGERYFAENLEVEKLFIGSYEQLIIEQKTKRLQMLALTRV